MIKAFLAILFVIAAVVSIVALSKFILTKMFPYSEEPKKQVFRDRNELSR